MECDYCKTRFMLHKDVYENEDNLFFFCPICGIPKKSICDMLIDSLTAAAESDGIGMYHDSEWLYIEIRDEISDFVEENF